MHVSGNAVSNALRINRNIVECKFILTTRRKKDEEVLIETLWNVNESHFR